MPAVARVLAAIAGLHLAVVSSVASQSGSLIGREVSAPRHLQDGEEFTVPLRGLLAHGELLFTAMWTDQEGADVRSRKATARR